jgi:putative MATE family efflux protein
MAGYLFETLYNLADAFFLGKLGKEALAAPSIAFPIIYFLIVFAFGFSTAGTTLISQSKGKNDRKKIDFYLGQTATIMIVVSILISITGLLLAGTLLNLMAVPEDSFDFARQYIIIVLCGLPFMFMRLVLQAALHGIGDSITPLYIQAGTVVLNIVLDPILIFGFAFIPALGVIGAAVATVFSRFIGSVVALVILIRGRRGVRLRLKNMRPDAKALSLFLRIGIPASIGQSVSALGFTILQGIVNSFGSAVIAAFGVANRIFGIFHMPAMGISNAMAVIVGQSIGEKNHEQAWMVLKQSVVTIFIFVFIGMAFTFFKGASFVRFFINDPEVLSHGASLFRIVSMSVVIYTVFMVLIGAFQGAGDTKPVMYLSVVRLWLLRLPIAYLLARIAEMGPTGIWISMVISNIVVAAIGFILISRGKWLHKLNPDEI